LCHPTHLFYLLQNNLAEKRFKSEEAVRKHLTSFFNNKSTALYDTGIRMLLECWKKIIEDNGEYKRSNIQN